MDIVFSGFVSHHGYKMHIISPASGEKKRKAITLEIKLKIIAQLKTNISVLLMFKVGWAKLKCLVG